MTQCRMSITLDLCVCVCKGIDGKSMASVCMWLDACCSLWLCPVGLTGVCVSLLNICKASVWPASKCNETLEHTRNIRGCCKLIVSII